MLSFQNIELSNDLPIENINLPTKRLLWNRAEWGRSPTKGHDTSKGSRVTKSTDNSLPITCAISKFKYTNDVLLRNITGTIPRLRGRKSLLSEVGVRRNIDSNEARKLTLGMDFF